MYFALKGDYQSYVSRSGISRLVFCCDPQSITSGSSPDRHSPKQQLRFPDQGCNKGCMIRRRRPSAVCLATRMRVLEALSPEARSRGLTVPAFLRLLADTALRRRSEQFERVWRQVCLLVGDASLTDAPVDESLRCVCAGAQAWAWASRRGGCPVCQAGASGRAPGKQKRHAGR